MAELFESTSIRDVVLPNRFVRSATWEGMATEDGLATGRLVDLSRRLTLGGTGLLISGHVCVSPEGQATPFQLAAYADKYIPGLRDLARAVHDEGGKTFMQLNHAGCFAPASRTGLEPIGPSPAATKDGLVGREMSHEDIRTVIEAFASAAGRAKTAGFDGIQIHGAHGYLVSQFLSPFFNKRTDEYGGTPENRSRIVREILKAIRNMVGADFPVCIKLNAEDYLSGGLTAEEMLQVSAILGQAGYDAIEMSGGTMLSGKKVGCRPGKPGPGEPEAYYEATARLFKERIPVPLMLVGGIRTFETAERIIKEGVADYVALCRPLIREPALVRRWREGDTRPASCLSDNGCAWVGFEGKGVYCVVEERLKKA